jgi:hypothetical protein
VLFDRFSVDRLRGVLVSPRIERMQVGVGTMMAAASDNGVHKEAYIDRRTGHGMITWYPKGEDA